MCCHARKKLRRQLHRFLGLEDNEGLGATIVDAYVSLEHDNLSNEDKFLFLSLVSYSMPSSCEL